MNQNEIRSQHSNKNKHARLSYSQSHEAMLGILQSGNQDPYLTRQIEFFCKSFRALQSHKDVDSIAHQHLKQVTNLIAKQILRELSCSQDRMKLH